MNEYAERVARGVLWLDHMHKGWRKKVNVSKLDIASPYRCILAQAFKSFFYAENDNWLSVRQMTDMGFDIRGVEWDDLAEQEEVYARLENEWRKVLAA